MQPQYFFESLFLLLAVFASVYKHSDLAPHRRQYSNGRHPQFMSAFRACKTVARNGVLFSYLLHSLGMGTAEGTTEECVATMSCSAAGTASATLAPADLAREDNRMAAVVSGASQNANANANAIPNTTTDPGRAKATTFEGVELPGFKTVDGVHLYRNGHGIRRIPFFGMNINIYVAAMYSAEPLLSTAQALGETPLRANRGAIDAGRSGGGHGPLQLDFTFLRYVSQSRVVSAWTQQLDHSVTHREYEGYEEDRALFVRLASGGPIQYLGTQSVQLVGDETRIIDQGVLKGVVRGRNFQRAFLSMWFGSMAVSEDLSSNLLRGDEHHPSAVWEVEQWLRELEEQEALESEEGQVPVAA